MSPLGRQWRLPWDRNQASGGRGAAPEPPAIWDARAPAGLPVTHRRPPDRARQGQACVTGSPSPRSGGVVRIETDRDQYSSEVRSRHRCRSAGQLGGEHLDRLDVRWRTQQVVGLRHERGSDGAVEVCLATLGSREHIKDAVRAVVDLDGEPRDRFVLRLGGKAPARNDAWSSSLPGFALSVASSPTVTMQRLLVDRRARSLASETVPRGPGNVDTRCSHRRGLEYGRRSCTYAPRPPGALDGLGAAAHGRDSRGRPIRPLSHPHRRGSIMIDFTDYPHSADESVVRNCRMAIARGPMLYQDLGFPDEGLLRRVHQEHPRAPGLRHLRYIGDRRCSRSSIPSAHE